MITCGPSSLFPCGKSRNHQCIKSNSNAVYLTHHILPSLQLLCTTKYFHWTIDGLINSVECKLSSFLSNANHTSNNIPFNYQRILHRILFMFMRISVNLTGIMIITTKILETIKKQHWNTPSYVENTLLVICIKDRKYVIKWNLWHWFFHTTEEWFKLFWIVFQASFTMFKKMRKHFLNTCKKMLKCQLCFMSVLLWKFNLCKFYKSFQTNV